jgi:predicted DNA-binding transcriptional regulator
MVFILQKTLIFTIPLLIVALAGMFAERSGIINIALDGIMIFGAFIGAVVAYNLRVLDLSFKQLQGYLKRKQEEKKAANTFLRLGDINDRQAQIIKMFVDNPKEVITVKDIQSKFFISATTAKGDIMGLVNRGLVNEFAFNKVKRGYVRSENFEESVKPLLK